MRALPVLVLAAVVAGCAGPAVPATWGLDASGRPVEAPVEARHDLVRAFLERGWAVTPAAFSRPFGVAGEGTAYRVQGRTVVVYDYASPAEYDRHAQDDAVRLLQLTAGLGTEVYRRTTTVVLTVGRTRTAFDLRLARLLAGPSLARTEVAAASRPDR